MVNAQDFLDSLQRQIRSFISRNKGDCCYGVGWTCAFETAEPPGSPSGASSGSFILLESDSVDVWALISY